MLMLLEDDYNEREKRKRIKEGVT